ncbi:MAG: hypothetical protein MJE66_02560, partial [Proteobacteria bacterium]|nr:hypothetical protein [Pseudomonadota bacterium]
SAGIAHEINNPIAFVVANLGILPKHWAWLRERATERVDLPESVRQRVADAEARIEVARTLVQRVVEVVRDVKGFAHIGGGEQRIASTRQCLDQILRVARSQLPSELHVECDPGPEPLLEGLPQELQLVLLNLILIASRQAQHSLSIALHSQRGALVVRVGWRDESDGAAPVEELFDALLGEPDGRDDPGLGLAVAREIVRRQGGELALTTDRPRGTAFVLQIPQREAA